MNLYLSSYRLGNHAEILQEMVGDNKKVAIIANSMDYVGESDRQRGVDRESDDMTSLGLLPEELDLRKYFGKQIELEKKLEEFGAAWVRGGNSFLLRQAMERSGFARALPKKLAEENFVYAGYSAGIVVLCPTLEGLELVDPVDAKPHGYKSNLIWRGLGILDYCIAPHFDSNHPESEAIDNVVDYFRQHEFAYKTLRDGEVIVVRGSEENVLL